MPERIVVDLLARQSIKKDSLRLARFAVAVLPAGLRRVFLDGIRQRGFHLRDDVKAVFGHAVLHL